MRDYSIGAQVLVDLGVKKIRLMTNNPGKYVALQGYDLEIVERVAVVCEPTQDNIRYMNTKRERMGHILDADMFGGCKACGNTDESCKEHGKSEGECDGQDI
jgi:3,4-dihydroxy 2-butanone 4-phosphate synthase/GTP cyclohydrolase II